MLYFIISLVIALIAVAYLVWWVCCTAGILNGLAIIAGLYLLFFTLVMSVMNDVKKLKG